MMTNVVAAVLISWTTNTTEFPTSENSRTHRTVIEEWTAVSFDLEGRKRSMAIKEEIYSVDSYQVKHGTNWVEQGLAVTGITNLSRIKVSGLVPIPTRNQR